MSTITALVLIAAALLIGFSFGITFATWWIYAMQDQAMKRRTSQQDNNPATLRAVK
jgi:hypothetical protein